MYIQIWQRPVSSGLTPGVSHLCRRHLFLRIGFHDTSGMVPEGFEKYEGGGMAIDASTCSLYKIAFVIQDC